MSEIWGTPDGQLLTNGVQRSRILTVRTLESSTAAVYQREEPGTTRTYPDAGCVLRACNSIAWFDCKKYRDRKASTRHTTVSRRSPTC